MLYIKDKKKIYILMVYYELRKHTNVLIVIIKILQGLCGKNLDNLCKLKTLTLKEISFL